MNSGASNVDNNVGYGGLTSNANRPFGCYHDVNGDNKYHLNTKVTATPCTVNYNCICKSFSASDTDPTYATNVDAMWTNGGNEGIRLRFSGVQGRYITLFSQDAMVLCEMEVYEDYISNLVVGKTATSSSMANNGFAALAINGQHNDGVYDSSNSQCVFTQETASWVQVDLGSYYMITEINLIGRSTTDSALHLFNPRDGASRLELVVMVQIVFTQTTSMLVGLRLRMRVLVCISQAHTVDMSASYQAL
jgi:hypothetical protein